MPLRLSPSASVRLCTTAFEFPPFDRHPDGDGSLRGRGLDGDTWRLWVSAVVGARGQLDARLQRREWGTDRAELGRLAEIAHRPAALCPGTPELRARLEELWAEYEPEGNDWKRRVTQGSPAGIKRLTPEEGRRLWNDLRPFHDRLTTISVFLVDYQAPVVMAVPPATCLIAPGTASGDYARQVLAAAEQLAAVR
jgi:hypothetical protein